MDSVLSVLAILLAALISPAIIKVLEDRLLSERRRTEERNRFQFETAIGLQEAIRELQIVTAKIFLAKSRAADIEGVWIKTWDISEFGPELSAANSRVTMLTDRLVDESLRAEVRSLWSAYSKVEQATDSGMAGHALRQTADLHKSVTDKLGLFLRSQ